MISDCLPLPAQHPSTRLGTEKTTGCIEDFIIRRIIPLDIDFLIREFCKIEAGVYSAVRSSRCHFVTESRLCCEEDCLTALTSLEILVGPHMRKLFYG